MVKRWSGILARMLAVTLILLAASSSFLMAGASAAGDGGKVVITSPEDGAVIKGRTVDVLIELRDRGRRGNHVHIYMDGRLIKPLYGDKVSYTFSGLAPGTHTISVRIATKGHKVLKAHDSVTVEVR